MLLIESERDGHLRDKEMLAALEYEPVGFAGEEEAIAALLSEPDRFDILVASWAPPLWCVNRSTPASVDRVEDQRIRAEAGMPNIVIRLSTLHPVFASVRCWDKVRA